MSRAGHFGSNVHGSCERLHSSGGVHSFHVVDTILHADDPRAVTQQPCQQARSFIRIDGLHADEDDLGVCNGSDIRCGIDTNPLPYPGPLKEQPSRPIASTCVARPISVTGAPARAEHATVVATDGAGADDRDSRPGLPSQREAPSSRARAWRRGADNRGRATALNGEHYRQADQD